MRNVIGAVSPFAPLRVDRILHAAAAALAALGAIVQQPRPHVEGAELETVGELLVELDLERIVAARADRRIAPLDGLILREGPQGLRHDAGKARIRRRNAGVARGGRVDVRLQYGRTESEHRRVVHVISRAQELRVVREPRALVADVGCLEEHRLADLMLHGGGPILIARLHESVARVTDRRGAV